jgi:polysaccharide export outer membrane protein
MTEHASHFTLHAITKAPFVIALVTLAALGCAATPRAVLEEANRPAKGFVLGPEDVLEVVVWKNQELTRQVIVRPDGMISLPLIGDVPASGLTANELADEIGLRLKTFKEHPTVSVSVKEVNSYIVYLLGEVTKPGKYQLKSYTTVLQAIAMAGGFTPFASKNRMHVLRNGQNGGGAHHEMRIPVKYDELVSGTGSVGNFYLRSGDTIVVP